VAEFFDQRNEVCCLALTEPNHGSDHVGFTEPGFFDPKLSADCRIRRNGEDYVINGQKSAWVSAGTLAGAIALFATFEDGDGLSDGAMFVLPADLPGISKGQPLDKIGQRPLNQGEIFFDNVRVPRKFMMIEGPEAYPMTWELFLKDANLSMAQMFVGVARAAYDLALEYARERVQGGVAIIEHQNVKLRLFSMYSKLEVARSHVRRLSVNHAVNEGGISFQEAASAKVFVTQSAFEIASDAIQTFGGYGLCREYPIEKIFRDARASTIEDGENSMLSIMAASRL
jgi:alkylation response protein AidB-like acyl-CoA dehydrogenase